MSRSGLRERVTWKRPGLRTSLMLLGVAALAILSLPMIQRIRSPMAKAGVPAVPAPIDGDRAFGYLRAICELGPRPAGSPANTRQRDAFLDSERWRGKAGAYGVQDRDPWAEVVRGSHSNVVGLPMERLAALLESYPSLTR